MKYDIFPILEKNPVLHMSQKPPDNRETEGVKTLLGDPKKAILKLALPMIVAMSVHTIYNIVDAIWVSGLGADALAAVGFFFPFFFMSMAIAMGLGMGGGSAISRRIGGGDKEGADSVASHTIVIMVIMAGLFTVPLLLFARPIFRAIGAGSTIDMTVSYSRVMFGGTLIIFFANIANALLRSEGDAKRAMYAMMLGGVLNIILDPLFIFEELPLYKLVIYGWAPFGDLSVPLLGLGVAGAAWATMISMTVTSLLLFNWLFRRRDTYLSFRFRGFKFNWLIIKDIIRVGIPSTVMQLSMSIMMLIMNIIVVRVGGEDGIAVFTTGWRVSTLAILPLMGIATAVISVTGAAYGTKNYRKMRIAFIYAVKVGIVIEIAIAFLTLLLAKQITAVFTWSADSARISGDLVHFIRIMCFFYPAVAFGMLSSAMFQGTGKGWYALIVTLIRTVVLTPPFTILFAYALDMGLTGIWLGIVYANTVGATISFIWARRFIRGLLRGAKREKKSSYY